jgi:hypothetical protein
LAAPSHINSSRWKPVERSQIMGIGNLAAGALFCEFLFEPL